MVLYRSFLYKGTVLVLSILISIPLQLTWEAMASWIEDRLMLFAQSGLTPSMSNVFPLRYKVLGKDMEPVMIIIQTVEAIMERANHKTSTTTLL